jgi:elongation factor 1-alpha
MLNSCLNIGFSTDNIQFIPYSGFTGHNLVNKYEDDDFGNNNKMNWYNGKTLLESLDEIKPVKRDFDSQLIISIFKAYTIFGVGIIIRGKILSGKLDKEKKINLNLKYRIEYRDIKSIQIYDENVDKAVAGDIISLHIKGIIYPEAKLCNLAYYSLINSFGLLSQEGTLAPKPQVSKLQKKVVQTLYISLKAKIFMLNKKARLRSGYTLTLFSYSLNAPINIEKIEYLVDGANKILKKDPEEIKFGEYAIVKIDLKTLNPNKKILIFDKFKNNPLLGSFELFNDYFIAVGKILDIELSN